MIRRGPSPRVVRKCLRYLEHTNRKLEGKRKLHRDGSDALNVDKLAPLYNPLNVSHFQNYLPVTPGVDEETIGWEVVGHFRSREPTAPAIQGKIPHHHKKIGNYRVVHETVLPVEAMKICAPVRRLGA